MKLIDIIRKPAAAALLAVPLAFLPNLASAETGDCTLRNIVAPHLENGMIKSKYRTEHGLSKETTGLFYNVVYTLDGNILIEQYRVSPIPSDPNPNFTIFPMAGRPVFYALDNVGYLDIAEDGINCNEVKIEPEKEPKQEDTPKPTKKDEEVKF